MSATSLEARPGPRVLTPALAMLLILSGCGSLTGESSPARTAVSESGAAALECGDSNVVDLEMDRLGQEAAADVHVAPEQAADEIVGRLNTALDLTDADVSTEARNDGTVDVMYRLSDAVVAIATVSGSAGRWMPQSAFACAA